MRTSRITKTTNERYGCDGNNEQHISDVRRPHSLTTWYLLQQDIIISRYIISIHPSYNFTIIELKMLKTTSVLGVLLLWLDVSVGFAPLLSQRLSFVNERNAVGVRNPIPLLASNDDNSNSNNDNLETMGLNELQTLLRNAVQVQDFVQAGVLSDQLFQRLYSDQPILDEEDKRLKKRRMSWRGLGAAPWLVDRLDSLNYTFPTTIQINAMEAVHKILNTTQEDGDDSYSGGSDLTKNNEHDMGIVISGTTGSGKTLGFLVPLLSTLSDSLFVRQRIRVGAEENVGDTTGNLLDRIAVVTSPGLNSNTRRPINKGSAIATGASLSTLGKSGSDVKSPLALIVVPTRELGIQTAVLLYELVGGSIKKDPNEIRSKANMFKYKGPKGIRIGCVLDEEESKFGLKLQTDVAITTPEFLSKLIRDNDVVPSNLRVIIYDEADLALEQTAAADLELLFNDNPEERQYSRLSFLVGASVTESLGNLAVKSRVLPEGKSWIASATRHSPLRADQNVDSSSGDDDKLSELVGNNIAASLKDLDVCLDPGLKHERVRVGNETGLLVLTRLLRKELKTYDQRYAVDGDSVQRPRVVVFFPDEAMAKKSIEPLRDSLWGDHKLCVLLPKTGVNPLQMMEQFKNNETTVMLATPNSVRGLDFPALTSVYTLYLPMDDPREYVHLAGRVGRVGQKGSSRGGGGRVVSVLKEAEAGKMEDLAKELGFEFTDVTLTPKKMDLENASVDEMRRYLEDSITFFDLAEEPQVDPEKIKAQAVMNVDFDDDDDDDDEEDEEEDTNDDDAFQ
jgi:superfamily II DNA/RNA helicase